MTAARATGRFTGNPILTASMVAPSRPDFQVVGVFNPAAIRVDGETLLLLRVAEAPRGVAADEVAAPIFDEHARQVLVRTWKRTAPGLVTSDSRVISVGGDTFLTSISHLRLARSKDASGSRWTKGRRSPRPPSWSRSGWRMPASRASMAATG